MPRPAHSPAAHSPAAAEARAALPAEDTARFDRLVPTVLSSGSLAPALRGVLPGPAGFRWLHGERLAPTTRPGALSAQQWLSLFRVWTAAGPAPSAGARTGRSRQGRPTNGHGHAPGAQAAPRWF